MEARLVREPVVSVYGEAVQLPAFIRSAFPAVSTL